MGVLGVGLYRYSMVLVQRYLPAGMPLVLPYLAAGAVSCGAALFYTGPVGPALRESAQESFGAGVGLLILAFGRSRRALATADVSTVERSIPWMVAGAMITVGFFVTLGRGFTFAG